MIWLVYLKYSSEEGGYFYLPFIYYLPSLCWGRGGVSTFKASVSEIQSERRTGPQRPEVNRKCGEGRSPAFRVEEGTVDRSPAFKVEEDSRWGMCHLYPDIPKLITYISVPFTWKNIPACYGTDIFRGRFRAGEQKIPLCRSCTVLLAPANGCSSVLYASNSCKHLHLFYYGQLMPR